MEVTQEQANDIIKRAHVHICIPCYGGMVTEAVMSSLLKFQLIARQVGLNYTIDTMINESLVTRARNNLAAKFLANKQSTHLFFIDSDIKFSAEEIVKLVLRDKDIVGGAYPAKKEPPFYVLNKVKNPEIDGELYEVRHLGTGFLMIKRQVFDKLIETHPETSYIDSLNLGETPDGEPYEKWMYNLFDCLVDEHGRLLSEDWVFCDRARQVGFKVWCDTTILLHHVGYHTFYGNLDKLKQTITSA